jgi:hypothetical protein
VTFDLQGFFLAHLKVVTLKKGHMCLQTSALAFLA